MSAAAPHQGARPASAPGLPVWVWLLGAAVALAVAYVGRSLLLPLLVALLGAYLLNPVVRRLQERGIARTHAVVLLFAACSLVFVITLVWRLGAIQAEGQRLIDGAPAFAGNVESAIDRAAGNARTAWPSLAKVLPAHTEPGWLLHAVNEASGETSALASQAGALLVFAILTLVFGFFLLKDGPALVDRTVSRIHPRHIETSVAVWAQIDRIIGQYLRGLALESAGVGILVTVGLWALRLPFPLLLGGFAAVVNPLPYIGVAMSLGAALLVALMSQMGPATLAGVIALFFVVRLVDDLILIPLTLGRSVHLHPVIVIVSILVGEHALGVLGMVLAVPTVTVVKEVVRLLLEHRRTLAGIRASWPIHDESRHIPL